MTTSVLITPTKGISMNDKDIVTFTRKNWWDPGPITLAIPKGRKKGSTNLQKAYDVALVADLVHKHGGDASKVQQYCISALNWTPGRWRTISSALAKIFAAAAMDEAINATGSKAVRPNGFAPEDVASADSKPRGRPRLR